MKLFLSIVFAVSVIMMLPGCKKDMNQTSQSSVTLKAEDVKITNMLEAFKAKMNSHLKDGELISTDSVVWYLEGCLNETYTRAADSIKTIWEDSAFVEIPNKDRMVLISDINNAYGYFVNEISKHYYSINEEKELVFVKIDLKCITDETIDVEMKDYVAKKPDPNHPPFIPSFGPTDYWVWGDDGGKCGLYVGTFHGEDAASQLTAKANILGYGSNTYWFYITTSGVITPDMVNIITPNPYTFGSSLLFEDGGNTFPEPEECLSPEMMNYYLTNLRQIGQMYKPLNRQIMNYYVEDEMVPSTQSWYHYHQAEVKYGLPCNIGQPPSILPVPHN